MYDKPNECPVCYEVLRTSKPLSCGHWVHKKCIVKSLKNECPICRKEVELTDLEKVEIKYLKGLDNVEKQLMYLTTQAALLKVREDALIRNTEIIMLREIEVKKKELQAVKKENELRELESNLRFKQDVNFRLFCLAVIGILVPNFIEMPFGILRRMILNV